MKSIKSHFVFTKEQRRGIFSLLLLIIGLQCLYFFVDFSPENSSSDLERQKIIAFQNEVDSLALIEQSRQYKVYPYNPNFITDYKGYMLGMSVIEIDRLHAFRKLNKYVNSANEFQQVTKVSDSLLRVLKPNFKFPDWVVKSVKKRVTKNSYQNDINKAEAIDIHKAADIEYRLAYRIINFRKQLGGFVSLEQLNDVYKLTDDDVKKVQGKFQLKTTPDIKKININLATVQELATLVYINDYLADNIVDERVLREGFKSLDELKYVSNFPIDKLERIKLYLTIN
ncbi:MAG: helix-hairpin-helix domain-containing protein [Flavobacteriaceae bacterium]